MSDDHLNALLKDYAAPVADDGFTVLVMEKAGTEVKRLAVLRARAINASFFVGGAVAAIQIPKLAGLLGRAYETAQSSLAHVPLAGGQGVITDIIGTAPSHIWIAMAGIAAALLWTVIDGDGLRL